MNWGIKTQNKLKKIIASSLGCDIYSIDPKTLLDKGYNIITLICQISRKSTFTQSVRKPKAPKDSVLVLILTLSAEDNKKQYDSYYEYWVEIPKKIASSMLILNHLP